MYCIPSPPPSTYLQYGKPLEYADQWETMGIGDNTGNRHFAARTKEFFGWIPAASVLNVKAWPYLF
jgi:hypothetical protein